MSRKQKPSAEQLYQRFVSEAGLFGKAFFGHRKSRAEARKLHGLWNRAVMLGGTVEQKAELERKRSGTTATEAE